MEIFFTSFRANCFLSFSSPPPPPLIPNELKAITLVQLASASSIIETTVIYRSRLSSLAHFQNTKSFIYWKIMFQILLMHITFDYLSMHLSKDKWNSMLSHTSDYFSRTECPKSTDYFNLGLMYFCIMLARILLLIICVSIHLNNYSVMKTGRADGK